MKQDVMAALESARVNLDQALAGLEHLPETDAQLVSYTVHKLKNYLTVVGATADLFEVYFAGSPDEQLRTWIEGVQHAVHLMHHDINRLMLSANGVEPAFKYEKVDMGLLVFRASNFYRRKSASKSIQVNADLQPDACFALTDRVAVAAVLDNLLSNAVKYSGTGKRVWIDVRRDADHIVCTVRDEGPGFSAEDQARLFRPGVRLANSPTGGETSTGYGLAVAKDLVERIGGSIACDSRPGEGAAFSIRLPEFKKTP
jgi:signal transduction histidine kinase